MEYTGLLEPTLGLGLGWRPLLYISLTFQYTKGEATSILTTRTPTFLICDLIKHCFAGAHTEIGALSLALTAPALLGRR